MIMVRTSNSSLRDDAPSRVSTVLNRGGGDEEFPRVGTEIVGLGEVTRTVPGASTECLSDRRDLHQRRRSARFSLFHWFKKADYPDREGPEATVNKEETDHPQQRATNRAEEDNSTIALRNGDSVSGPLERQLYSSSGSVDTTCSTATVHSFTFRRFRRFRKHSSADDFAAVTTAPRRSCVNPFASDPSIEGTAIDDCVYDSDNKAVRPVSCLNSAAEINLGDQEDDSNVGEARRVGNSRLDKTLLYDYRSLPTSGKTADLANNKKRLAHVRGKRPAPKPPGKLEVSCSKEDKNSTSLQTVHGTGRRKRRAPEPPEVKTCTEYGVRESVSVTSKQSSSKSSISNDTLKLECGVLLPTKSSQTVEKSAIVMNKVIIEQEMKSEIGKKAALNTTDQVTHVAVAPRPWYKRSNTTLSERDICGSFRREVLKIPATLSKSKDKSSRFSHHETHGSNHESTSDPANISFDKSFSRLNHFFGRNAERRDDGCRTKKDEKRKSNLSILTNISELDREAAAIVQEEQARNQALLARSFSAVDESDGTSSGDIVSEMLSTSIEPQRRGTRALISKFNAISNITKVTVNATFFAKSSANVQPSGKTDRAVRNNRNDRVVTKRLLYDGNEQVNETGDVSSINFFRRLEAEASSQTSKNDIDAAASAGWEEKIKRYFPERAATREEASKNHLKQRQSRNSAQAFEFPDARNARRNQEAIHVNKIEHLSRADLKEMLIEMKHSLPKRPKPKSNPFAINDKVSDVGKAPRPSASEINDHKSRDAATNRLSKLETRCSPAVEVKRKALSAAKEIVPVDKTKVSSAAQTSANLRKVERQEINNPRSTSSGWKGEDTIYTTKGRKSATGASLTRNTFQLIRPRDFACIEALKTDKGPAREGQNTYMNVIEDSIYANTVIYPAVISGEPGARESVAKIYDKIKNPGDTKPETVQHYIAKVVADVNIRAEPAPKQEVLLPSSETIEGARGKASPETNMNTLAINRLLRKLEGAIASGQHQQAAGLAKELAQLKIHCSVVRQRSGDTKASDIINVDMYIEDKLAHQGPMPLQLSLNMTVTELKKKVFAEFEIPTNVQRWIIGKNLADNDDFTLNELKAVDKSSIFLYLVAPDLQNDECTRVDKPVVKEEEPEEPPVVEEPPDVVPVVEEEAEVIPQEPTLEELKLQRYEHLMSLENSDVIPNSVPIECPICFAPYGPCEGVILRDCLHMFCRTCIANTIMYCEEAEVKCPFRDSEYTCESTLQEREIKALVTPEIYEQHLAKSVSQAENNAGNNAFHCKTPDCRGWCIYDDNVNVFLCPVCGVNNCLTCQAIHTNKNCREYQDEIRLLRETDQETKRTAAVLEEMVESGEALACPTCAVVLMKKWGCDWLRCSMCKTEICWVTRGPRWGPGGKGDTSGGCKCGENGVKCHPRCNYCH